MKAQPALNEEIIRRTVEEATGQQLVRTTAMLQPAVAEIVRDAVGAESELRTRELKTMLSREVENAVKDPLAVMAQYTQTLPAIDKETIRYMVREAAEQQFERSIEALQPVIADILRSAIAAEYQRQTQELKSEIFCPRWGKRSRVLPPCRWPRCWTPPLRQGWRSINRGTATGLFHAIRQPSRDSSRRQRALVDRWVPWIIPTRRIRQRKRQRPRSQRLPAGPRNSGAVLV